LCQVNSDFPTEGDCIIDHQLQGKFYISYQDKEEIDSIFKGQILVKISRGQDVTRDNRLLRAFCGRSAASIASAWMHDWIPEGHAASWDKRG
jgi:hypothetical protein